MGISLSGDNPSSEMCKRKYSDESLRTELFRKRHEAVPTIGTWRPYYNEARPHFSLDYLTPIEFKTEIIRTTTQPRGVDSQ